jgi:hypothetical protein
MIDRVYQTLRMLANTEIRGNMKPFAFNLALYKVMCEIFEEYPFELNKWTNRLNKGLVNPGDQNIVDLLQEKMDFYLKPSEELTFSGGKFTLPEDLHYLNSIFYTTTNGEVELSKNASEFNLIKRFKHTQPSADFPIGLRAGNSVEILPSTIQNNVIASYRRKLKKPKWTFTTLNGAETFNPDAADFSDIDMHESEFDEIVNRLCVKVGIHVKENDLKESGNEEEIKTYNKENSN